MDKRFFLAIGLSMLVLIVWYTVFPPPPAPPPEQAQQTQQSQQQEQTPATTAPARNGGNTVQEPLDGQATAAMQSPADLPQRPATPELAQERGKEIRVETPRYVAVFDTAGGRLISLRLKEYRQEKAIIDWGDVFPPLREWLPQQDIDADARMDMVQNLVPYQSVFGVRFEGEDDLSMRVRRLVYEADAGQVQVTDGGNPGALVLTGTTEDGLTIRKRFTFQPDSYVIGYEMAVINYGEQARRLLVTNQFGEGPRPSPNAFEYGVGTHLGPIWREEGSVEDEDADDIEQQLYVREPEWMGVTTNYFLTAARPESRISRGVYRAAMAEGPDGSERETAFYGMELPPVDLAPQKMVSSVYSLYFGPKKTEEMAKFGHDLEQALDLNLSFISMPMLAMLKWFHGFVGNYGVAIILLTVLVRLVLFPLTYKGMLSMKRMQKLQPRMKALREKYKDNREKQNQEMMALYKRNKVNPLGGCLPILIQIPIFFSLYTALLGSIELRHAEFMLWLTDLSQRDGLFILPLLMGISIFLHQKMTPTPPDPLQAKIMMWLPVFFTVFMFGFPSGLVLYWFTSNVLSVLQQVIINRAYIPDPEEAPASS